MQTAPHETGRGKDATILRLAARMPAGQIALHFITRRVRLQESHPVKQRGDVSYATVESGIWNILDDVRAHDEVIPAPQRERRQIFESAQTDVSPTPVSAHHKLAGVHTPIPNSWPQPPQLGTPCPLPRSDVQYGSYLSTQKVFGDAHHHSHLAAHRLWCMNTGTRIAVPFREVRFVVDLTIGASRQRGGNHAERT